MSKTHNEDSYRIVSILQESLEQLKIVSQITQENLRRMNNDYNFEDKMKQLADEIGTTWGDLFEEPEEAMQQEFGNEEELNKDQARNQEENKVKFRKQCVEFMNQFSKNKHLQANLYDQEEEEQVNREQLNTIQNLIALTENKLKTPKEEEKRRAEQIEEGQRRVSEIREKLAKKEDELKECRSQVDEMKNNFDREKKKINQEINHKEQTLMSALETMKELNENQETLLDNECEDQKDVMKVTQEALKTEQTELQKKNKDNEYTLMQMVKKNEEQLKNETENQDKEMAGQREEIDRISREQMLELKDLEELKDMKKKQEEQKAREQKEDDLWASKNADNDKKWYAKEMAAQWLQAHWKAYTARKEMKKGKKKGMGKK